MFEPDGCPPELFDGHEVYFALTDVQQRRTSPQNVSDTLDAVVKLIRGRPVAEQAPAPEPRAEDFETCMCGDSIKGHSTSGHSPVSAAEYFVAVQPSTTEIPAVSDEAAADVEAGEPATLRTLHRDWTWGGDVMTCRSCRRQLHVSRGDEMLNHTADCPRPSVLHPWATLRRLLQPDAPSETEADAAHWKRMCEHAWRQIDALEGSSR